jgi:hypothetical protein
MNSGMIRTSNIYHTKGIGILKEKIIVPNIISDHPILIFKNEIPIPLHNEVFKIMIQDKNIIKENKKQLEKIKSDDHFFPTLMNPNKEINIKKHQINFSNTEYIQEYEHIRNTEKERFKELKQKKTKELICLLENDTLGREPYQKLAALLQTNSNIKWWNKNTIRNKMEIINEFKKLYKHDYSINFDNNNITKNLIILLENIINNRTSTNLQTPKLPKSRARDQNGFSQRELASLIGGDNLRETAQRTKYLLEKINTNPTGKILLHNTSKILLKIKKEPVESS